MAVLSRRDLMIAAASGAAVGPGVGAAQSASDPRHTAEGQVKMSASLDGGAGYWVYSGVIYAVRPNQHPLAILAIAGCESHWPALQTDGSWRVTGTTLSYFRDLQTGAFLNAFDNPFTGKQNTVKPNLLSGGGALYPADGTSARAFGQVKAAVIAPDGFRPADPHQPLGGVRWSVVGPSVMLMTDRSWNVAAQPQLEAQTQTADRAMFFDRRVKRMPASYTATTIIPWMTWMDMGSTAGHLVWHTSGEKGFSLDAVPHDYRAKAGELMDRLASRPA